MSEFADVTKSYDLHAAEWAKRIEEGANPAHTLLEKPAMRELLPNLSRQNVLAIGCGSGEEIADLLLAGAEQQDIVGVDVSAELLEIARQRFPETRFEVRAMQNLHVYQDNEFDFVYSSLTLHYALDWMPILAQVKRILRPGGKMLFSTHHPVKWGAEVERGQSTDTFRMSYERPKSGMPTVHGDYLRSREIKDKWFGTQEVTYFHRPMGLMIGDILAAGLGIRAVIEPAPIPEAQEVNPGFAAIHSRIPLFMIFDLEKVEQK